MLTHQALDKIRSQIDLLDLDLLKLLANRKILTQQVGAHKIETNAPTRDLDREKQLIKQKIEHGTDLGLSSQFVHELFQLIIEQSVRQQYQMKLASSQPKNARVAFLGDQGSYSHQALMKYFSSTTTIPNPFGYKTFEQIVEAVNKEEMDVGILPIENTTTGAILEVYDLLQGSGVHIVGEEVLEINHCLVGKVASSEQIKSVLGHPQAISQCNKLLSAHPEWKIEYCESSADAIEQVLKRNDHQSVAIANKFAAELYHLDVVLSQTANQRKNFTRFILVAKEQTYIPEEIPAKISIVFATGQQSGALAEVLNQLKSSEIVLTKLQSRPIPEMPWEEMFYADLIGHIDDPKVQHTLEEMDNHCRFLKVLGCYANCKLEKVKLGESNV